MEKYYLQDKTVNVMYPRSYYIPFSKTDKKSFNREDSSLFTLLNGTWNFEAYDSVSDAEDFFLSEGKEKMVVPGVVQLFGYDYIQYTNTNYPFPFNPPHIPSKNPAFHYSRHFECDVAKKNYLVFEGVDSCFYLYVNNKFVGYSNISHRISEFDISNFVTNGDNKVDVLVVKWNMSSYLEDQDKLRFSGIFRDVYLLTRTENHIVDYEITTDINGSDGLINFKNKSNVDLILKLNSNKVSECKANESVTFTIKNAKLWSAESPNLYELDIESNKEVIYQKVGICTSKVIDGVYYFNNQPIKFYGVNRHDMHPTKGPAVSKEDMLKDILLMKSLNVNAVRTSHYPSSPLFYEMCNEYGLYVVSESDLENHGGVSAGEPGYNYPMGFTLIADRPEFIDQIVLRQVCNFEVNKNFSCVVIYSLGNESGWGDGLREGFKKMKSLTNKPIHYEGLWEFKNLGNEDEYYSLNIDMVSRMYATPDWMKDEYLNDKKETRPLILCEYAHAMGNGPGAFDSYWNVMESNKRFMGGFVWEWCDHGLKLEGENVLYGGDYGEFEHDSNFCIDGIVTTDREIKSGTLYMKKVYEPIGYTLDGNKLAILNKNYFINLTGVLKINNKEYLLDIKPRGTACFDVENKDLYIEIVQNGAVTSKHQFIRQDEVRVNNYIDVELTEKGHQIIAKFNNNEVVFDKDTSEIESMLLNGKSYGPVKFNLYRAPIDNDRNIRNKWDSHYLRFAKANARAYKISADRVEFDVDISVPRFFCLVTGKAVYRFTKNGVELSFEYEQNNKQYYDYLPRIGLVLNLDGEYDSLEYKAYGPCETYKDSYKHMIKDIYKSSVKDQYFHYVKPQESGSHYGADYVRVGDGKNTLCAYGMETFSCLEYSIEELTNTMHDFELKGDGQTHLCLDFAMSGLGSNSCGPLTEEYARVPQKGKGIITIEGEK